MAPLYPGRYYRPKRKGPSGESGPKPAGVQILSLHHIRNTPATAEETKQRKGPRFWKPRATWP